MPHNDATPGLMSSQPGAPTVDRGAVSDASSVRAPGDIRPRCDFCGNVGAQWAYPVADFEGPQYAPGLSVVFRGPWHACTKCHSHVETYRWGRMRRRTLRRFKSACGPLTGRQFQLACRQLDTTWHGFRVARTGPAYRVGGQS
jgi:hypothetical protein